jgi:hypothetical protein
MNVRTSLAALVLCLASTAAMAATAPIAATTPAKPAVAAKAKVKAHKHAAITCKAGETLEKGKCVAEVGKP